MKSPLEPFHFLLLLLLHRLPENDIHVLNHFKHKIAISMLRCLFIIDHTIEPCFSLMIHVFMWQEYVMLHVYKLTRRWKITSFRLIHANDTCCLSFDLPYKGQVGEIVIDNVENNGL
jgi:hypothetical protein